MEKFVKFDDFWVGAFISAGCGTLGYLLISDKGLSPPLNIAISIIIFILGMLFTYLHLMVSGINNFARIIDGYPKWLNLSYDFIDSDINDIKNILDNLINIKDKVKKRKKSMYNSAVFNVLKKINYELTELANDEYKTSDQVAFESYNYFIDQLKPNEEYLSTSCVGVHSFWKDDKIGKILIDKNKSAIERGVKIKRIFILQSQIKVAEKRDILDEIRRHKSIGINVSVVFENNLPDRCKIDFGIFNFNIIGYLDMGQKDTFLGIRYYFSENEVEKAKQLYKTIEEYDVVKNQQYASIDEFLERF